jgi:hypothetical protein
MRRFLCFILVVFLITAFVSPINLTASDTTKHVQHDKKVEHVTNEQHQNHNHSVDQQHDDHGSSF